jgi:hypothetical protein
MVVFNFVVGDVVMPVTDVNGGAMVVFSFVIADVPKLVNGNVMVVSGYVLMLVMGKIRSAC